MVPNLVFDGTGATANLNNGMMLHHFVLFNPAQQGVGCPISEPFFGAGNERTHAHLPTPFGYTNNAANWNLITHVVNKSATRPHGQRRGHLPLAAAVRDRRHTAAVARHRLHLQRRQLRVHDPAPATPTRT